MICWPAVRILTGFTGLSSCEKPDTEARTAIKNAITIFIVFQYCIKSEAAYANLKEITDELLAVDYTEFNDRYNQRDITARKRMRELVDSDANTVTKVFSTLFER